MECPSPSIAGHAHSSPLQPWGVPPSLGLQGQGHPAGRLESPPPLLSHLERGWEQPASPLPSSWQGGKPDPTEKREHPAGSCAAQLTGYDRLTYEPQLGYEEGHWLVRGEVEQWAYAGHSVQNRRLILNYHRTPSPAQYVRVQQKNLGILFWSPSEHYLKVATVLDEPGSGNPSLYL